jgi:hypothetical protein
MNLMHAIALALSLMGSPADPLPDPHCAPMTPAEDDFALYRDHRWYHADGNAWGWAREEDAPIFNSPDCIGYNPIRNAR